MGNWVTLFAGIPNPLACRAPALELGMGSS
jgi:hypothetical protein